MANGQSIIAARIRQWLKDDHKAVDLARAAGLSEAAISNILSGKRQQQSAETLISLARAMRCSVDYLLGMTDDPTPTDTDLGALIWELAHVAHQLPERRQRDLLLTARAYLEDSKRRAGLPQLIIDDLLAMIDEAGGQFDRQELEQRLFSDLDSDLPALEDGE